MNSSCQPKFIRPIRPLSDQTNILCRKCGKVRGSLAHVLAGCSSLAQIKYMDRRNAALKVLSCDMLRDLKLADSVPPWYSQVEPQVNKSDTQVFLDVPVRLSQQGGCAICRSQSEEGANCGNELPLVEQPHEEGY